MDAKELRIGNYFRVNWSKEIRKADVLDIKDIAENKIIGGVSPIPLTPEILEACGFDLVGNIAVVQSIVNGDGTLCRLELVMAGNVAIINNALHVSCSHLHQLQNLYYSLTGEELQVNLKEKV